ncbi:MAG TPA: class I SAM-dependent methyltransferase [Candidatus Krumholzibacteria bacterium]
MASTSTTQTQIPSQKGHRWFAALYDRINARDERRLGPLIRPRIAGEAHGRVLEIGAGTGANFPYYPADARVVATEPDPFMLKRAEKKLAELAVTNIEIRQSSADELPFEEASFDHVVSTLVLCSVPEQSRALGELRRVLRPTGSFRFLEHVRNDDSRVWGTIQDAITPVWRQLGAGCHPNRRTRQAIEEAGFELEWLEKTRIAPGTFAVYGVARPTRPRSSARGRLAP